MHRKLLLLSLAVGTAAGGAAVLLQSVIRWIRTGLNALTGSAGNGWMVLVLPGIGMLLSLIFCKYIIKRHDDNTLRGCRIWAESELGKGSTFHFILAGSDNDGWTDPWREKQKKDNNKS